MQMEWKTIPMSRESSRTPAFKLVHKVVDTMPACVSVAYNTRERWSPIVSQLVSVYHQYTYYYTSEVSDTNCFLYQIGYIKLFSAGHINKNHVRIDANNKTMLYSVRGSSAIYALLVTT